MYVSDSPACRPLGARHRALRRHNGVVGHGRARAIRSPGRGTWSADRLARTRWPSPPPNAGMWTATISSFAERHSAYHWTRGSTRSTPSAPRDKNADEIYPSPRLAASSRATGRLVPTRAALGPAHAVSRAARVRKAIRRRRPPSWLDRRSARPALAAPTARLGAGSVGFSPDRRFDEFSASRSGSPSAADVRQMFDGYDVGVRYADERVGRNSRRAGRRSASTTRPRSVVSSDRGETLGELGIYCDHQTADLQTHRVPAIVRWPGLDAGRTDTALHYQV